MVPILFICSFFKWMAMPFLKGTNSKNTLQDFKKFSSTESLSIQLHAKLKNVLDD